MSRLGRKPILLPKGVKVTFLGATMQVEGPKGKLIRNFPASVSAKLEGEKIIIERKSNEGPARAAHGMMRSILNSMVKGVAEPFTKTLVSVGVGYRMSITGNQLTINSGYSHSVAIDLPAGVTGKVADQTKLVLTSIDKELLGIVADRIRHVRPPEPYKGKGIRYEGEVIQLKEGKAATKGK